MRYKVNWGLDKHGHQTISNTTTNVYLTFW